VTRRQGSPRVLAIVPAHDEEPSIARTVKALKQLEDVTEVIVVSDGSTDRTDEEAAGAGARVLVSGHRRGKGQAVEATIGRVRPSEVYLLVDGDVGDTGTEAERLLEPVLAGRLDLAIGRLPPQEGGGFGLVKRAAGAAIRMVTGLEVQAPLSGQRAVTRRALEMCRPLADGFGMEVAMTMDAARLGFRVGEVTVNMTHRATGRGVSGFAHRARQGLEILQAVAPRAVGIR
jgi:glycosyltransferase involved in cell wall biosynthesis